MTLQAIWAESRDRIIGLDGRLPWHIPEDLAYFSRLTAAGTIIMGRGTWESLPCHPLPGRTNVVLSSRPPGSWSRGGYVVSRLPRSGWIIGGGDILRDYVGECAEVYRTVVDIHISPAVGATRVTHAPLLPAGRWRLVEDSGWLSSVSGVRYRTQRLTSARPGGHAGASVAV